MHERLRGQFAQRTEMLAGVSHDLRTPLTRIKLQLAMLGDNPEISELKSDVQDMERMVEGYLAFARGEGTETPSPTDLVALVSDVVGAEKRDGSLITLALPESASFVLEARPQALKRALANLITNAKRYADRVTVSLEIDQATVLITVDDDGPGIPKANREDVFKPFFRLDASRNPKTGGTGLGLTIARDIARSHGGDLSLDDGPAGGLRARMSLPI
jgi:two-component system osmolarity sensor histidine kinase EnvZ